MKLYPLDPEDITLSFGITTSTPSCAPPFEADTSFAVDNSVLDDPHTYECWLFNNEQRGITGSGSTTVNISAAQNEVEVVVSGEPSQGATYHVTDACACYASAGQTLNAGCEYNQGGGTGFDNGGTRTILSIYGRTSSGTWVRIFSISSDIVFGAGSGTLTTSGSCPTPGAETSVGSGIFWEDVDGTMRVSAHVEIADDETATGTPSYTSSVANVTFTIT